VSRHPQTIETAQQFDTTEFEVGVLYDDGDPDDAHCRNEYMGDGTRLRHRMGQYPDGARVATAWPKASLPLTLVSEPELEPTPDPAPAVTEEQRVAYWALHQELVDAGLVHMLDALPLPDALTNPQPALPTEPGLYVDARGEQGPLWRVAADKTIGQVGGYGKPEDAPKPFRRLVVADDTPRHVFTGEELQNVFPWSLASNTDSWNVVANYINTKEA